MKKIITETNKKFISELTELFNKEAIFVIGVVFFLIAELYAIMEALFNFLPHPSFLGGLFIALGVGSIIGLQCFYGFLLHKNLFQKNDEG